MEINEERIREIVREELSKTIMENVLAEYAATKVNIAKTIETITPTMFQHWCLVKYVTITGNKQQLKEHWKGEVNSYIRNIANTKIKPKNNRTIIDKMLKKY